MMAEGKNVSSEDLNRHFNKTDKINRIFNDILRWQELDMSKLSRSVLKEIVWKFKETFGGFDKQTRNIREITRKSITN